MIGSTHPDDGGEVTAWLLRNVVTATVEFAFSGVMVEVCQLVALLATPLVVLEVGLGLLRIVPVVVGIV